MLEVHSGIKVVDDAINKVKKQRCSILVMGRKAAETFIFQLAKSLCEERESQSEKAEEFQTIYVNFNDSDENFIEKAERIGWGSENEKHDNEIRKPDDLVDMYIDMYDRRSVGGIDYIVKEISDKILEIRKNTEYGTEREIVIIVNSLSRLALYLEENKVLDLLATMNFLDTANIPLLVFFFLDDSLHEPLFINRVRSLVDGAIVFREDHQMEITENFFSLEGFGEPSSVTKWYPCLDIKEYGIVPVDFLELSNPQEDEEFRRRIRVAEARMVLRYGKREDFLNPEEQENYESLKKDEKKLLRWMERKQSDFRTKKDEMTFRTGIWAIDRIFSGKDDHLLGGIEHYYGIAIYYDVPPIDMHPVFAKILCQCFEDEKPFIEISIDDTPDSFLGSLDSHGMKGELEKIKEEWLEEEKPRFKFINSYGVELSKDLKGSKNIINIDNPYNVTIMLAKYRAARESLLRVSKTGEDEIGPVIWLNSYTGLASVTSVDNAFSFGLSTIMARDVWSPGDKWKSLMLFSMQKYFLSPEDDANLLQALDGTIEFSSRRILGNRMYYFSAPKMPKTNKMVPWTPYRIKEKLGFLPLDEETVYDYLKAGVLKVKGSEFNG